MVEFGRIWQNLDLEARRGGKDGEGEGEEEEGKSGHGPPPHQRAQGLHKPFGTPHSDESLSFARQRGNFSLEKLEGNSHRFFRINKLAFMVFVDENRRAGRSPPLN